MEISYPKRNSNHADSFEVGNEFQDFVCMELAKQGIILQNINSKKFQYQTGENLQGFEIKFDGTSLKTGRLSIEVAEKKNGANDFWVESGIYRGDNSWLYIQGNYSYFWIFSKNILQELHKSGKFEIAQHPKEMPTINKFYLPFEKADRWCSKKIIIAQ